MTIRPANPGDREVILDIFTEIVAAGETFALPRDLSRADALAFWCGEANKVFVCENRGRIPGSYYLKPNHSGPGNHVANAGYIVAPSERGGGIGRAMAEHSIEEARRLGFRSMQFNFVVSTNESALRLWKQLGFAIVGTLPGAFDHPTRGYVDAYVMYMDLTSPPACN
jgi:L-amino acid N-acyltransferase YncA